MTDKNQIIVLGTIHEGHLKHNQYSFSELRAIILNIAPDVILGEIPPNRFAAVSTEFQRHSYISDSRMADLPEYQAVIFPVAAELNIRILPISAWTNEMNELRQEKLDALRNEPVHLKVWEAYQEAHNVVSRLFELRGNGYDPLWIDSTDYDEILKIELDAFDAMFNGDLNCVRLEDINYAHYRLINNELDKLTGSGIRVLLTFGAGHKGWMRAQLAKRDDIEVLTLSELF